MSVSLNGTYFQPNTISWNPNNCPDGYLSGTKINYYEQLNGAIIALVSNSGSYVGFKVGNTAKSEFRTSAIDSSLNGAQYGAFKFLVVVSNNNILNLYALNNDGTPTTGYPCHHCRAYDLFCDGDANTYNGNIACSNIFVNPSDGLSQPVGLSVYPDGNYLTVWTTYVATNDFGNQHPDISSSSIYLRPVILRQNDRVRQWLHVQYDPMSCCSLDAYAYQSGNENAKLACKALGYIKSDDSTSTTCTPIVNEFCQTANNAFTKNSVGQYVISNKCVTNCTGNNQSTCVNILTSACADAYNQYKGSNFFTDYIDCGCFSPQQLNVYCDDLNKVFANNNVQPPICNSVCSFPPCIRSPNGYSIVSKLTAACPSTTTCVQNFPVTNSGTIDSSKINIDSVMNCGNKPECTKDSDCNKGVCTSGKCVPLPSPSPSTMNGSTNTFMYIIVIAAIMLGLYFLLR